MPRIEACGTEVDKFCQETGEGSSTLDICLPCAKKFSTGTNGEIHHPKLQAYNGEPEPDYWADNNAPHPPYGDMLDEGNPYKCEICGHTLSEEDD